jgi:hypothetical protein
MRPSAERRPASSAESSLTPPGRVALKRAVAEIKK